MIRDTTVDVGIVGAGGITEYTHAPIVENTDRLNLSYIADANQERAQRLRDYADSTIQVTDPGELPPCDVAVIAIPLGTREQYHEEFSRREIPVFVEKPFARNEAEHDTLVDLHDIVFCDYMRACFSSTRQVRRIIHTDVFGPLKWVAVTESGRVDSTGISTDSYKLDPSMTGGGVLMERGCHSLSQLAMIFEGNLSVVDSKVDYIDNIDVEVTAEFAAELDGRTVPITYKISDVHPLDNQSVFAFENGTLVFDQEDPESTVSCYSPMQDDVFDRDSGLDPNRRIESVDGLNKPLELAYDPAWADDNREAFYLRWREFMDILTDCDEYDVALRTGRDVTRVICDIYE